MRAVLGGGESTVSRLDDLRAVTADLAALGPEGERVAAGLRLWWRERHLGLSLEVALLGPESSGAAWLGPSPLDVRAALLGQLAALFPAGSISGRAKAMAKAGERFACAAWPKYQAGAPDPPATDRRATLFLALHRCGTTWPLSWRHVLRCLSSRGFGMTNPPAALSESQQPETSKCRP